MSITKEILKAEIDRVQTESVHTAVEPEFHVRQYLFHHFWIVEIEVGLAGQEVVQVVLPAPAVPGPC